MFGSKLDSSQTDDDIQVKRKNKKEESNLAVQKLQNSPKFASSLTTGEIEALASILTTPEKLKTTYLATKWVKNIKLVDDEIWKKKEKKKFNFLESKNRKETKEEIILEESEIININLEPDLLLSGKSISIKLLIAEIASDQTRKIGRELISPFLSAFKLSPEFGLFHTGLLIGPWILEWTNSALIIPRKCVSKAGFLAADIGAITKMKDIDKIVDIMADQIALWNSTRRYNNTPKKQDESNCQDFVNELLQKLGIEPKFEGALGHYINDVKTTGHAEMCFTCNGEFSELFNLKSKRTNFKTHEELDKFVHNLFEIDPDFKKTYSSEFMLLKSFDRAFWLRHYSDPKNSKYSPHFEVDEEDEDDMLLQCPFGDPQETYSINFIK
eukprot:gene2776-4184_t